MELNFTKYQGAGNDFVILNKLEYSGLPNLTQGQIATICDRNFGIGADGLIVLAPSEKADFEMIYYNADGNLGSLCGNGSRCAVYFYYIWTAKKASLVRFSSYDGIHTAHVVGENTVKLQMSPVEDYLKTAAFYYINTGSPHIVIFKDDISALDMLEMGSQFRNSSPMKDAGCNVNLVQASDKINLIRTFERGVEGETLACGTGVTAAALIKAVEKEYKSGHYKEVFRALGGELSVHFSKTQTGFKDIYLEGPAQSVFTGRIKI